MSDSVKQIPALPFPPITREQLKEYAEVSGDYNPIHLDDEAAKRSGLPGVIVHGMLVAGLLAERGERWAREQRAQGKALNLKKLNLRFKAMTFPGDVISIGGVLKNLSPSEVALDLEARNQRGEITTTAVIRYQTS